MLEFRRLEKPVKDFATQEEFERSREHYVKLAADPERMQIDLHEGGHEIRVQTGLEFLGRWLS